MCDSATRCSLALTSKELYRAFLDPDMFGMKFAVECARNGHLSLLEYVKDELGGPFLRKDCLKAMATEPQNITRPIMDFFLENLEDMEEEFDPYGNDITSFHSSDEETHKPKYFEDRAKTYFFDCLAVLIAKMDPKEFPKFHKSPLWNSVFNAFDDDDEEDEEEGSYRLVHFNFWQNLLKRRAFPFVKFLLKAEEKLKKTQQFARALFSSEMYRSIDFIAAVLHSDDIEFAKWLVPIVVKANGEELTTDNALFLTILDFLIECPNSPKMLEWALNYIEEVRSSFLFSVLNAFFVQAYLIFVRM
jgi:hypothetical protein